MNAGLHRKLTLISAPAGFGKTTLLSEWASQRVSESASGRPVAWLSLDEGDNDLARFLTYCIAALQTVEPNVGKGLLSALQSPQPPPVESVLTALINEIAAVPHRFILVLDDYHIIAVQPIHDALEFLLNHLPDNMRLVIATRSDPPWHLAHLRGRGQLTELRTTDLRFTPNEVVAFLNEVMGLGLSAEDVATLAARTEGWIAGLQMAALLMQGREDIAGFIAAFTGSHRYILDYLMQEVFQRQPSDVQEFLLKTSILDRFTAPLCDAVVGISASVHQRTDEPLARPLADSQTRSFANSQAVLEYLDRSNLFIVPLDESREWYRYHRLFADLLRQQLRTVGMQDLVPLLHQRASQWYEAAGFPADAVQHALTGSDWERAASLIRNVSGSLLNRGELMTLLGWLQSLPDEIVRAHSGLCLDYGWALILTGQINAAESRLEQAKRAACGEQSRTTQDEVARLGNVIAAQAYVARIRGDDRRTIELSEQALSLLPQDNLTGRSIATLNLGMAHWNSGHLAEAERALTEADHAARQAGNHHARLTALCFLGRIQAARGNLYQAAESHRQAIRLGEQLPAVALVHIDLSALLYEWNDLEAATDHLRRGIELSRRSGNVEVQISGYYMLALTRQAQGDGSAALAALETAHRLARDNDVPPLVRAGTAACHAQIALAQGDLITATRWVEQMTDVAATSPFHSHLGLTPARLLLAQNQKEAAAEQLEACYETAVQAGWQFGVVEVRVLQALAAPTPATALAFLADGLALAQPGGYIRTFVDLGEPMATLLREAAAQDIAPEYVAKLLAASDAEVQRGRGAGEIENAPAPLPPPHPCPSAP